MFWIKSSCRCAITMVILFTVLALAATTFTNIDYTWIGGTTDFSGVALFKIRVAAGLTTTVNGAMGYDTTNNMLHSAQNSADAYIPQATITPNNNDCVQWVVSGSNYKLGSAGVVCGGGGGSGWTYLTLGSTFATTSATAVDVTGIAFTPSINTNYEFECILMTRTATTTVGPRPGWAWPTAGVTDGTVAIKQSSSVSANVFQNGNFNAAVLSPVGGLPNTTQSYPAKLQGILIQGGSITGTARLQLASETAGTSVEIRAGSFCRYKSY